MDAALQVLGHHFGFDSFRPAQQAAIHQVMANRDVQVLLPTGGGKSLIYQVPAVVRHERGEGLTLVISPLISLMEDQVRQLTERRIPAAVLHSGIPWAEQRQVLARGDQLMLLYVSPERLSRKRFRDALRRIGLAAVAVDEAHCISEWGHDFRPHYRELSVIRNEWPEVPICALTATAIPQVMVDICDQLHLRDPAVIQGRFHRPNLTFSVEHVRGDKARIARVMSLLSAHGLKGRGPGRAVVYASTRKRVKSVADVLRTHGYKVGYYHAGRTDGARAKAQEKFAQGQHRVLVATTAFGMGVDHPDIRLVVHVQAPHTLESYYQQAGRAGRDGDPASCVLLYSPADARTRKQVLQGNVSEQDATGWKALQDYIYGVRCRQQMVAQYFVEDAGDRCGRCDVCLDTGAVHTMVQASREESASAAAKRRRTRAEEDQIVLTEEQLQTIVDFVSSLSKPVGRRIVALGLRGSKSKDARRRKVDQNPYFGTLKLPERSLIAGVDQLLRAGRLVPKGKKYPTVWLPDKRVRPKRDPNAPKKSRPRAKGLAGALKRFRQREARKRRWKAYQVFSNDTLDAIVSRRPGTRAELLDVPGMGPTRLERYGDALLRLISEHP